MLVAPVSIEILPDDVLLLIFHFDRVLSRGGFDKNGFFFFWRWHRLVHVCQRWRTVVFASPNFLELRVVCAPWTRAELTSIWPPLPIIIKNDNVSVHDGYDFNAAIVHPNRVREIDLINLQDLPLQRLVSAMQEQFPTLIHLNLHSSGHNTCPLSNGFLAPRLRYLMFHNIPFPALPKFLLSTTDLVRLTLVDIPDSGYFSPELIVTGLAVLANLKFLSICFGSHLSHPRESQRPPPPTRIVLPALTWFAFSGDSEYSEDLVARIDAPLLGRIHIYFFHPFVYDIPQLAQFMRRTTRFRTLNEAHVNFDDLGVEVGSLSLRSSRTFDEEFRLRISCEQLGWQLSSLARAFTSLFPSIYTVEHLYIHEPPSIMLDELRWRGDIENIQWLEFLRPFTAVKNLYLCSKFTKCVAVALQEFVGERAPNVLPALEKLILIKHLLGPDEELIGPFVAARRLLGRPVTVSHWHAA